MDFHVERSVKYSYILQCFQMFSLTIILTIFADGSMAALPEAVTSCKMYTSSASGPSSGSTLIVMVPELWTTFKKVATM